MPINNLTLTCVNHTNHALTHNKGTSNADGSLDFVGTPIKFFHCDICGYVELYVAHKTDMLESNSPPSS